MNLTLDKGQVMKAALNVNDEDVKKIQYHQTLQPLEMDPTDLVKYMSQCNARKDQRRLERRQRAHKQLNLQEMSEQAQVQDLMKRITADREGVLKDPKERKNTKADAAYFDETKFMQDYEILQNSTEFKNRPELHLHHEFRDKLVVLQKVENAMHKKLDIRQMVGPTRSKKASYFESIQPRQRPEVDPVIAKHIQERQLTKGNAKKKINTFHDEGKEHKKNVTMAKLAQRHQMVHTYRDRLFTRFKV